MHTGACSRDEPQPKLSPAMTTGYSVFISPSSMNLHFAGNTSKIATYHASKDAAELSGVDVQRTAQMLDRMESDGLQDGCVSITLLGIIPQGDRSWHSFPISHTHLSEAQILSCMNAKGGMQELKVM